MTMKQAKETTRVAVYQVKAAGVDESTGTASFTGYASTFDFIDSYGDVVRKGAFATDVAAFKAGDSVFGCYYAHSMNSSPYDTVGVVKSMTEDDTGLLVDVELYVDDNPAAAYLYKMLQEGVVREMSFAYKVTDYAWEKVDDLEVFAIKAVELLEVSVCPVGVNRQALIQEVKARVGTPLARKSDGVLVIEDESALAADEGEPTFDRAALRAALVEVQTVIESSIASLDDEGDEGEEPEEPTGDSDDPDVGDVDETSGAAATDDQKALALRARAALAKAAALTAER